MKKSKDIIQRINGKIREKYSDKFLLRLVSSYSVLLILFLIIGIFTYNIGINSVRDNLIKENNNILKNSVTEVDKSFQIMLSLNYQIANNPEINKFVQADKENINSSFFLNVIKAKNYLTNLLSLQNLTFIENLFVYSHSTDYILSASEIENSSLYYHYNRRYNELNYDKFMDLITNTKHAGKPQKLMEYSNTRDDFLLYPYPISMYRVGTVNDATICYTINKDYMENIFSDLNLYDLGFIYVTDSTGKEMMEFNTPNSMKLSDNDIDKIKSISNFSKPITLKGQKLVISAYTSPDNQWSYYLVQPYSMVFYTLNHYQDIYLSIISVVLMIGLVLLFVLSHSNIIPLKQIEGRLEDCLTKEDNSLCPKSNDVRNSIDYYINVLIDKKASMQQMLELQRPIIFTASLSKLMNGLSSKEEIDKTAEILHLKQENNSFTILYVNVCLNEMDFYIDDSVQVKGGYQEVIKEVFYKYFGNDIYIYEVVSQSFSILLQAGEKAFDYTQQIPLLFQQVYEELKTKYSLIIYGGISDTFTDLMFTWQAYHHAVEALNYAGLNHTLQQYDSITKNINSYYYPLELEQQLISFITNGKQPQVQILLNNIYNENFNVRSLPITMIKCLLSDIRNTLLKIRFMLPSDNENPEKLISLDEKLNRKKSYELIQEIAYDLCDLYETKTSQNILIDKIKQYIKTNYMDSSLSLCKISEEFNISESYFSYLFKEVTKENFSEHLEKLRIDKAYQLLMNTTKNITDIAKEVGYNNTASFRRAFKRIGKITPVEVRKVNLYTTNSESIL